MIGTKPRTRAFTESDEDKVNAQLDRIEKGINRLLNAHGLQQTGANQV